MFKCKRTERKYHKKVRLNLWLLDQQSSKLCQQIHSLRNYFSSIKSSLIKQCGLQLWNKFNTENYPFKFQWATHNIENYSWEIYICWSFGKWNLITWTCEAISLWLYPCFLTISLWLYTCSPNNLLLTVPCFPNNFFWLYSFFPNNFLMTVSLFS